MLISIKINQLHLLPLIPFNFCHTLPNTESHPNSKFTGARVSRFGRAQSVRGRWQQPDRGGVSSLSGSMFCGAQVWCKREQVEQPTWSSRTPRLSDHLDFCHLLIKKYSGNPGVGIILHPWFNLKKFKSHKIYWWPRLDDSNFFVLLTALHKSTYYCYIIIIIIIIDGPLLNWLVQHT